MTEKSERLTIEEIAQAAEEAFGGDEVAGFASASKEMYAQMGINFLNKLEGLGKPLEGCYMQGCTGGGRSPQGFKF